MKNEKFTTSLFLVLIYTFGISGIENSKLKNATNKKSSLEYKTYDEFCNIYSDKLTKSQNVSVSSRSLINTMKKFTSNEQNIQKLDLIEGELQKIEEKANGLLKQILKNDFEITVMGSEKAGKSSPS